MRKLLVLGLLATPSLAWAATGSIEVRVDNAPGELILDGFPTGQAAPATLESVPVGTHEVELEYGCLVGVATVEVQPDELAVVDLPVENRGGTGTIRIRNLPYNAEVLLDGAPTANAEEGVEADCGARQIEVEAPGFAPWSEVVVVTTGKWANVDVALEEVSVETPREDLPPRDEPLDGPGAPDDLDDPMLDEDPDDYDEPLDELDLLDEDPEDEGRRRDEPEEDPDERDDPRFDDDLMADPDFRDDDYDDYDDYGDDPDALLDDPDDYGLDEPDYGDDELDDIGSFRRDEPQKKERRDRKPFPTRPVVTGAFGGVALGGIIYGAALTDDYRVAKANYDALVASRPTFAASYKTDEVDPLQRQVVTGYVIGALGAGAAGISWLMIPPREDSSDLVVSPTGRGVLLSGRF